MKQLLYKMVILLFFQISLSQTKPIIIQQNIKLPKDSIVSKNLVNSLNGFLSEKVKPNNENTFVMKEDLLEMSILLDEMKNIEKSGKYKDDNFYKGYLSNVIPIQDNNYLLQISYIGVNENVPYLMAVYEIVAKQKEDKFYFMSPLKRNTSLWKSKKIGDFIFHYKEKINSKTIKKYIAKTQEFDKKLNSRGSKLEWYGCNDMFELLNLIGVSYNLKYNGRTTATLNAFENNTKLIVDGSNNSNFNVFDPHDLFHERAGIVISPSQANRSMVCGTAYIYGGSWGMSWNDISKRFKETIGLNSNSDWLKLYSEGYNFGESQEKHLLVTQYVNALIVKDIDKKQEFSKAIELLSSGNFKQNPENFFKILEENTGINKSNFNEKVQKLITEEIK
jgi:hypothetical protein